MNFAFPKVQKGSSSTLLEMGRQPCCDKSGLKRGPWTMEEDQKLIDFIINNGIHCWRLVPKLAGLMRCGKSCRLRWTNYLRPDLKRGAISEEEEDQMIQLHSHFGNRWSKIASYFPGRTDNEIKNHWNTRIKKRFKLHGLDPVTHKLVNQQPEKTHTHQEANFSPQASASQAKNTDASAMPINPQQQSETERLSLIWMPCESMNNNNNNAQEIIKPIAGISNNTSSSNNCSSSLCNTFPSSSSSMESVLAAISDLPRFPTWEATYPLEDLFLYGDLL